MQYLKESVRDRILEAALDEFLKNGFKGASLRRIAECSEITVGNIYRYFESKNALLDAILGPFLKEIDALIEKDFGYSGNAIDEDTLRNFIAIDVTRVYKSYPKEFQILRHGMQGTMYNAYYEGLLKAVTEKIKVVTSTKSKNIHPLVLEVIARNQIDGIIFILEHSKEEDVEILINQFFGISLRNFKTSETK